MLKRLLCCLLCFCMLFSLVSCGNIFDFNGEESTTEEYVTTKKPHKYDDEDEEEDDEDYEDEDGEETSEDTVIDESSEEESEKPNPSGNEKIKIGLSAPLTGAAAIYGVSVKNAAQLAVDEINADGGIYGIELELKVLDDKHDATRVAANYSALMDWGMQVSLGCVTSTPCIEFARLSQEDNVFFMTPSASADAVVEYDNAYQMCFADGNQGTVAANYVNNLDYDTIGILYKSDDPYSKGIYDTFKANLDSDISTVEASFVGEYMDFTTQIDVLRDCEFIFMPIYRTPASSFMLQAKDKIAPDAVYYGCDGFDGIEYVYGFDITSIPQKVTMLSHFNPNATEGAAGDFIKKYTEKFGTETLNQFGASAYDCVYAIFSALKEARALGEDIKPTTPASDICEILKAKFGGSFVFSGVTGEIIRWKPSGFVDKLPIALVIKESNQ